MKRLILVGLLVLLLAAVVWADPRKNNKKIQGHQVVFVETDSTGDSTYASGNVNLVTPDVEGFRSIMATVTLRGPISAYPGVGNQDSGWVWLRAHWAGESVVLDSTVANSIPVTLRYVLSSSPDTLGGDTLLKDYLSVSWAIFDSIGDTTVSVRYDISWDINLK